MQTELHLLAPVDESTGGLETHNSASLFNMLQYATAAASGRKYESSLMVIGSVKHSSAVSRQFSGCLTFILFPGIFIARRSLVFLVRSWYRLGK